MIYIEDIDTCVDMIMKKVIHEGTMIYRDEEYRGEQKTAPSFARLPCCLPRGKPRNAARCHAPNRLCAGASKAVAAVILSASLCMLTPVPLARCRRANMPMRALPRRRLQNAESSCAAVRNIARG